ncbi:U4/U6 small nuclear ribonucleoprotein PRP4 [Nakaseomyces bracarensis]|uniref:U4/U6 small nuclear ribonucleoprotein PRP4 n=1 Tax=Nakaseomyces bracarensis TaxID=273131 RepID=A0ABR4NZK4_9SACH
MGGYSELPVDIEHRDLETGESTKDVLRRYELQRELDSLVPTAVEDVEYCLAQLGEPQTLGSEDNYERRLRLTDLLIADESKLQKLREIIQSKLPSVIHGGFKNGKQEKEVLEGEEEEEEFYTPASPELIKSRKDILYYSIGKSRQRLSRRTGLMKSRPSTPEILLERRAFIENFKRFKLIGTQVIGTRPISTALFSNNCERIVTGSWSGDVTVVNKETMETITTKLVHEGNVGAAKWSPDDKSILTTGKDGFINIFNDNLLQVKHRILGHENRITDLDIHPSGRYFATSSFDLTWKLWDLERGIELQNQEGHSKELYCIAFQPDGSLVSSAGSDKTVIVWDLRSGKSVLNLIGHAKPIYCMDWSLDGYTMATGGGDGIINIWDIRKSTAVSKIPAHNNIVTSVRFDKERDFSLISAGYDKMINTYSKDNYIKICSLEGHTDKILTVDIDNETGTIVSGGWDRSLKLWSH